MNKIKVLDEKTIQKIAAGEIIERPSSIAKELIENSLDANSSSITIEIRDGGKSYMRITDDGDGILEDDLGLAFQRHTTSKLSNADDLFKIMSFGFRGEALASISTVAKVEVLTKTHMDIPGIQAFVEEGKIIEKKPVGCPKGTTMIVRDLFYNVPVREKFLKSNISEANHVSNMVYKLALGNYGVSFKYIKDNKIIFQTSKNNDMLANIYTLLGKDFTDNLLEIEYRAPSFRIFGYISNNIFYRGNRSHQYLYVNNRYINNDHISKIIEDRYRSIIPVNKFPIFILFIDIDPSFIDVNIHPTKQQIKFINQNQLDAALEYVIDSELKKNLSIPKILKKQDKGLEENELPLLYDNNFLMQNEETKTKTRLGDIPKDQSSNIDIDNKNKVAEVELEYSNNAINNGGKYKKKEGTDLELKNLLQRIRPIGILFSTYILAEDIELDKVLIIDQHAAHERIMYEKYKMEYAREQVVIQNLLTPEIVELTNVEIALVIDNIELFRRLGFVIEEFGTNSIIIRGVPLLFGKPQTKELFLELVDAIKLDISSSYEVKLDKIMKIACTRAIKAGDNIIDVEIDSLLDQLSQTTNPYTCPHGRPTIVQISREDLEKEFKRIM